MADVPVTPASSPVDELGARLEAALGEGYAVEGRLGAGGFAVVYLVRDTNLKRKLAVKVLSPDVITSRSVLERFRREAETVAQLSHPHIVPLHFIGQKDDLVYLVMQAIGGGSLADRIEREGPLAIDEATRIFGEVASALGYAHSRGVVHRDIKPQNVLLDADTGRALVTDFGIARTAEGGSLTATGMVVGTPAYLSPEQVTGEPSDHRSDIYALGVMAYEMLSGKPPFTGSTPTAVLMKRLTEPPPPLRSARPDVPEALEELVNACMAADPNERIQSAGEIPRALTGQSPVSGTRATTTRARVTKPASRSKLYVAGGVAIGVVAIALAAWLLSSNDAQPNAAAAPRVDSGMVLIPAGTYVIGSNDDAATRPSHPVQLEAFGLDAYEVTVAQYEEFAAARGTPRPWGAARPQGQLPVTGVRLAEAQNYCSWRHPGGGRLPTEAEWEAAARGIEGRLYAWGREWNPNAANVANVRDGPAPVGSYPEGRTPEGVYDMIGNVWEWTSTPFTPSYGETKATNSGLYVIRGGGFSALRELGTAVARIGYDPAAERENLAGTGFRCAMPARKAPTP